MSVYMVLKITNEKSIESFERTKFKLIFGCKDNMKTKEYKCIINDGLNRLYMQLDIVVIMDWISMNCMVRGDVVVAAKGLDCLYQYIYIFMTISNYKFFSIWINKNNIF